MQDAKEEVRDRLAIEDVIGEYVELKRAGRNLKGLSPFTDERTPSFIVSPEKRIWHDFSSGRGGDVFSFVMLVEGLDFREALERLAHKAGVDLSVFGRGDRQVARRRTRAREALRLAARFYQQVLLRTPPAYTYTVKQRGFDRQTIASFQVGYAPEDGRTLVRALQKRGFSREELADAGLTNRYGGDLFRGRMMVAFSDPSGDPVGFTGRIIRDEPTAPKYLNTSQTLLFDKSRYIFGLYQAKEAIRREGAAVIVEGNLDVMSSHQIGVKHVVATSGTAITEQHLKTLSRLAGRIKLAFDGDQAGLAATERAISLAQRVGVELEVIVLPADAKDPDELIRRNPEAWRAAVLHAIPAVEWAITQYSRREDLTTAQGKRRFSSASLAIIKTLHDSVEQEHYLKDVSRRTGASMLALTTKLQQPVSKPKTSLKPTVVTREKPILQADSTAEIVLGLALTYPSLRRWLIAIQPDMIEDKQQRQFLIYLQQHSDDDGKEEVSDFLQNFETYVKIVQLKIESRYANWQPEGLSDEMARLIKQMIRKHRDIKKQQLLQQLREAEDIGDEPLALTLRTQLNQLIKENM